MSKQPIHPEVNGMKKCTLCGETEEIAHFYYEKKKMRYRAECSACRGETRRKRYLRERKDTEIVGEKRAKQKKYSATQRIMCVKYKGGKCAICGYYGNPIGMDLHHIKPYKENREDRWSFSGHPLETNKPELDKCVLLCAICHREVHAGIKSIEVPQKRKSIFTLKKNCFNTGPF